MPDEVTTQVETPVEPNFYDEEGPSPSFDQAMRDRIAGPPERDEQGRFKPKTSEPTTQESAPADAPEKTAEVVKDSAPATEKTEQEETGKEASKRIRQLVAEVKELRAKVEQKDVKAESSTAKTSDVKADSSPATLKRPRFAEFQTTEAYEEALEDYEKKASDALRRQTIEEFRQTQQMEAQQREFNAKVEEGRKRYADTFESVIVPTVNTILQDQGIPGVLKQYLNDSPHFLDLLYVLGEDDKLLNNFIATSRQNPSAAMRQLVSKELELMAEAKAKDTKPAPQEKPKTKAPEPIAPVSVSARATRSFDPNDESLSAEEWAKKRWEQVRPSR